MTDIIKKEIRDGRNIFLLLVMGVSLCMSLYIYLMGHTVYAAVERQRLERSISSLEGDTAKLEAKYLEFKEKVTPELAKAKGFKELAGAYYISRRPQGLSLK